MDEYEHIKATHTEWLKILRVYRALSIASMYVDVKPFEQILKEYCNAKPSR